MNLNKNRALILVLAVLFVLAFFSFAFWKLGLNPLTYVKNLLGMQKQDKPLVFKDIAKEPETPKSDYVIDQAAVDDTNDFSKKQYKLSVPTNPWDWQTDLVYFYLYSYNSLDGSALVKFIAPKSLAGDLFKNVVIDCSRENTITISINNLKILGRGAGLEKEFVSPSLVYSYCADEACTKLTNKCYLIKDTR